MAMLGKSKRGSIQDIAFMIVVFTFMAVMVLITSKITSTIGTQIAGIAGMPTEATTATTTLTGYFPGVIDNTFLFLVIGLSIVAIALASMVRVHPVFIALYVIILIVLIVISGAMSNLYQGMADDPNFSDISGNLTFISLIMTYLPLFIGVIGTILAIVMYKTWSNEQ